VDFFAHQDQARRNTLWLILYFVLTVITIMATVYFASVFVLFLASKKTGQPIDILTLHPQMLIGSIVSVASVIGFGTLYKTWQLGGDGSSVALSLGGVKVQPNTVDLEERILLNVVEEMALASGTPVPPVYVMNHEKGINAFAAGTSPQNAVVGVTRGCLETLKRDELQGVIAHEFSHILNGDMRLNVRLIGLLHGILLIAMIGYTLFRIASSMPVRTSSKDDEKGAMGVVIAMFAMGALLLGIGYAGVFFASLIQAAVSRQREFLADASAVQFTRNPSGISGALKRIGGWKDHAIVRSVFAKEASHMFFGQGVASQWFATHPALQVRIRRIEPQFQGSFGQTSVIQHSESDIVDTRTLGFQQRMNRVEGTVGIQSAAVSGLSSGSTARGFSSSESNTLEGSSAHAAALAGVHHFESNPHDAVNRIGNPEDEHIQQANRLLGEIPSRLIAEVHEPFGAMAVIYALLCAPHGDPVRSEQIQILERFAPKGISDQTLRLLQDTDVLLAEQRLPLACMAVPALDLLSHPQTGAFRTLVRQLIDADRRWTIFEYALQRFITKRIVMRTESEQIVEVSEEKINKAFLQVLSSLAHLGSNVHAQDAYGAGWQAFSRSNLRVEKAMPSIVELEQCTLKRLDLALDLLANVSSKRKRDILNAFSECIVYDQRSTINEVELLRVISDALGCPMPPVLDLAPMAR
jgi:Zn-dependent protease with chaperone function